MGKKEVKFVQKRLEIGQGRLLPRQVLVLKGIWGKIFEILPLISQEVNTGIETGIKFYMVIAKGALHKLTS